MKVTRLLMTAGRLAAMAAAIPVACAGGGGGGGRGASGGSGVHAPARNGLRLRSPDLDRPLHESYPERSETEPADPVERAVFDRINADREAAGLPRVAWDEGAARSARQFTAAQIRERTRGHYLTDGLPPYARTAFAGLFGVQAENSATFLTSAREFQVSAKELALASHRDMIGETPPDDGHRRTILDPTATHVGLGWASQSGSFRMAEEFMTRRLAELTLTRVAVAPETILIEGRILSRYSFEFVTIAHEPAPRSLTRAEADARTSYAYPDPQIGYVAEGRKTLRVVGADTQDRVSVRGASFSFRFTPSLPGLWTVLVYTSEGRKEPRPGGLAVFWMEPAETE